jgi:hypothetical protein
MDTCCKRHSFIIAGESTCCEVVAVLVCEDVQHICCILGVITKKPHLVAHLDEQHDAGMLPLQRCDLRWARFRFRDGCRDSKRVIILACTGLCQPLCATCFSSGVMGCGFCGSRPRRGASCASFRCALTCRALFSAADTDASRVPFAAG